MLPAGVIAQGLVAGSLAGINAIGIVMLWRTNRLVNLAQPSMGLVGGVLTGLLIVAADWPFWLAVPVGLGMGALLGLAADRIVLRRLREAPRAVLLVATIALAQVYGAIQTALPFAFGGTLPTYQIDLGFTISIHPTVLLGPHILTLVALPLTLAGSLWFLYRSRFGIAALALGQDAERAQALGIPAAVVRSAVWAVAGLISTVGGILAIPVLGFGLGGRLAPTVLLLALAPAVFAGLRSLTGAAVAALAVGVAYRAAQWYAKDGPVAELIVAALVILAIAVQGRRLGRGEAATRASSWESAATPRPLPPALQSASFVTAKVLFGIVMVLAMLFPNEFLRGGKDAFFVNSASLALGALAVCVAWMFAGEVALGHWGFAGLAAALTVYLPGPWPQRVVVTTLALGLGMAGLGWASRRRAGLGFAVIGLAAAAAASTTAVIAGDRAIDAGPDTIGPFVAVATIVAAIGILILRSSPFGARLVAARDDPDRALWFGINPVRARMVSLGISGALVGLAGSLYASSTSIGLSGGSFADPTRSLLVLSLAVIGGLGSPVGTLLAVVIYETSAYVLPAWGELLTSGVGVLLVVIFMPGGLGRAVTGVRDLTAKALKPREHTVPSGESPADREAVHT